MKYLFFYVVVPMAVSFVVQSILCREVKTGILRHAALMLTIISLSNQHLRLVGTILIDKTLQIYSWRKEGIDA